MNICFFTKHQVSWGSSRERIGVYLEYLKKRGHSYKVIYCIPDKLSQSWISGGRLSLVNKIYSLWYGRVLKNIKVIYIVVIAAQFGVVVVQKLNLSLPLLWFLRARNKNIIFDFDDQCFWDLDSTRAGRVSLKKNIDFWRKGLQHPKILKLYKHIIAGNSYIASIAASMKEKDAITIIPTSIDCRVYCPSKNKKNPVLIIGWAGSGENHLRHLKLLVEPLKELAGNYIFRFKLVGATQSEKIKNLFKFLDSRFICVDWVSINELPGIIRDFDIGVMPLQDDDQARGKCGFKALQYMASGVPVVISNVGVNNDIVKDGINGFLAKDKDEWFNKLSRLIQEENLRKEFAQKGRQTVEEFYSIDKTSSLFAETIERLKK